MPEMLRESISSTEAVQVLTTETGAAVRLRYRSASVKDWDWFVDVTEQDEAVRIAISSRFRESGDIKVRALIDLPPSFAAEVGQRILSLSNRLSDGAPAPAA